ncbi:MAG: MarR family transcriptional regulator, partial [Candidatus Omnitrophica bacterium]|nr:MarR family transcriptional regulator [Candidatus Omnitrophota bacterium]
LAIAELLPHIMRGVRLDFFIKRGVTQSQFLLLAAIRAYGRPSIPRLVSLTRDRGERGRRPTRTTTGSSRADLVPKGLGPREHGTRCEAGRPPRAQSRGGRCTMGMLARSLHVSMPTATGVVTRLVRDGYVCRAPQADDRRQVLVELTPKALGFFHEFQAVIRRRWEEALVSLNPQELRAFYDVLTTLRDRLQTATGSRW